MSISIITDSTSYIPKEYIDKYHIKVVSLSLLLNNNSYRELDLNNDFFYDEMSKSKEFPKSSQPTVEEMYKIFEEEAEKGNDIVGIFISSEMSGTYSTANLVKNLILENYDDINVEIIDSRSNCMQLGFSVIEAAKAAKENKSMEEVVEAAENVMDKSRFLFVPDNLEYLKKGGRIGGASAILGKIFQIIPILTVYDGKTAVFDKVRTKKKAIDKIIDTIVKDVEENGLGDIVVHHINCENEGKEIADRLGEVLKTNIKIQAIGPIVGLHVGPKSIGVVYYKKN